jgi:hypothetical protein
MRRLLGIVLFVATLAAPAATASAADPDPASRIVSPFRNPYGASYEVWTQRYMTWVFTTPGSGNPVLNPSCDNLVGRIWYMPQTLIGNAVKIHCKIGSSTPILISPGGTLCDTSYIENPATLRTCAEDEFSMLSNFRVWIDGVRIQNLDQWLFATRVFPVRWPAGNVFDVPPGRYLGAARAYTLMLRPLPVGRHTIIVHDEVQGDSARVTAFLTVVR